MENPGAMIMDTDGNNLMSSSRIPRSRMREASSPQRKPKAEDFSQKLEEAIKEEMETAKIKNDIKLLEEEQDEPEYESQVNSEEIQKKQIEVKKQILEDKK